MATLTINLEDDIAKHVVESARREHKSVSDWVTERVKPENDRAAVPAATEAAAREDWLAEGRRQYTPELSRHTLQINEEFPVHEE